MISVGPLNYRCRIERRATTLEASYGTDVVEWKLLRNAWCNVQDTLPSRAEDVAQGMVVSKNQVRLRLRYCTDIDSTMRIIINRPDAVIYQIISGPAVLGDKFGVEFMLERVSTE